MWLGFKHVTSPSKILQHYCYPYLLLNHLTYGTYQTFVQEHLQQNEISIMNCICILSISLLLQNYPRIMASPFMDMACFVPPVGQYNILVVPAKLCQAQTTFNIKPI